MFVVAWTNRCTSLKIIHLRELGQSKKRSLFQCFGHTRNIQNNKIIFFWSLCQLPSFVFFKNRREIPRLRVSRILLPRLLPVNVERGRGRRVANPRKRIDFINFCDFLLSFSSYFRISNFTRKFSQSTSYFVL